jgi:hypothetical protein
MEAPGRLSEKEDSMRSRTLQGITAALLTASALWLAGSPAMAMPPGAAPAGLEIRLLEHLWQWLGDFWEPDGLTKEAFQEESSAVTTSTTWTEPEPDRGAAIDPNGER